LSFRYHNVCDVAARKGELEILKWATESGCMYHSYDICKIAVIHGHLNVLLWAITKGGIWRSRFTNIAIDQGHLVILLWAHSNSHLDENDYLLVRKKWPDMFDKTIDLVNG
jgi:hypothetical protein